MSAKNDYGLTSQQEHFACLVASGKNQSEAYREAYPKSKSWKDEAVWVNASKLMAYAKVSLRVSDLQRAAADKAELDVAETLLAVRRIATSDISAIYHPSGKVKLPHELDPATRAAVKSFKIDEYGKIEYQFWDKNAALEKAMKALGLYREDNKQKTDPLSELIRSLSGNVFGVVPQDKLPSDDE